MAEILMWGTVNGGSAIDVVGQRYELDGPTAGAGHFTGTMTLVKSTFGFVTGTSNLAVWAPDKIVGHGRLSGAMEVVCTPHVAHHCEPPRFRMGHPFGPGDLEFIVADDMGNPLGAFNVGFTLYQIQRGCFPKQMGAAERTPVLRRVGVYYATGTAGECGQPGLWMIRWCYRKIFGGPRVCVDCYFYVLDSVLLPVPGDTLPRVIKWGWD